MGAKRNADDSGAHLAFRIREGEASMPRKQRFKPSRKPKPSAVEGFPQDQVSHPRAEDIESAQPARQQGDYASLADSEQGPK